MKGETSPLSAPLQRLRQGAAMTGAFNPHAAVQAVLEEAKQAGVRFAGRRLLSALEDDCLPLPDSTWVMRNLPRQKILSAIGEIGAKAFHQENPVFEFSVDTASREAMLDALAGSGRFSEDHLARLLDQPTLDDREDVELLAVTLDRLGPIAKAYDRLPALRALLDRLAGQAQSEAMVAGKFVGREAELKHIDDWIQEPISADEAEADGVRALFITGLPGAGKSFLLEKTVYDTGAETTEPPVIVRLDFDRRNLNVQSWDGLLAEFSRQIAGAVPEWASRLAEARAEATKRFETVLSDGKASYSAKLMTACAQAIETSGRPVLVVLDTLEVLRAEGETHPRRLFEFLDACAIAGISPMSVIAAGRGDALSPVRDRYDAPLSLKGLDDASAGALLDRLHVPENARDAILNDADGNPLLLKLMAAAASTGLLADVRTNPDDPTTVKAAYIYRSLLSRFDDDGLRAIAHPGLVLRRVSPDAIENVLIPALKLPDLEGGRAAELFGELQSHHWLVEPDPFDTSWVLHRSDIRRVLLPMLYESKPDEALEIDRRAKDYFADSHPVDALYHALQATRGGGALPKIDRTAAMRLTQTDLDELPPVARDAVNQVTGRRILQTSIGEEEVTRARRPSPRFASGAARSDMMRALDREDLEEAKYLFDREFEQVDPVSKAAPLALAYLWRSGQWSSALQLHKDMSRSTSTDFELLDELHGGLADLEIRAERNFDLLVRQFVDNDEFLERSEATLNHMRKNALPGGALDFAIKAAHQVRETRGGFQETPSVVDAMYARDASRERALHRALSEAENRGKRLGLERVVDHSRLEIDVLPGLNPYEGHLSRLVHLNARGYLRKYPVDILRNEYQLSNLFPLTVGIDGRHRRSIGGYLAFDILTAAGLASDWSGAFSMFRTHPHLSRVARAAERWRRSIAGDWRYGRSYPPRQALNPPLDDIDGRVLRDRGLDMWVSHILNSDDPTEFAMDQLCFWAAPVSEGAGRKTVLRAFEKRLRPHLDFGHQAARRAREPERRAQYAAETLQQRGLPRSIAAPLAVLCALNAPAAFRGGRK